MPGHPCCCDVECEYFSDDFNRGDSSNIGADWDETVDAGDWEITSGTLTTSDDNTICLCNTDHPDGSAPLVAIVTMIHGRDNDNLRLILGYEDGDNYSFVDMQRQNGNLMQLEVFERSGGADGSALSSETFSHTEGNGITLKVCWTGDVLETTTSTDGIDFTFRTADAITSTDTTCGLATGTIGLTDAEFNDFSLSRHSTGLEGCPDCPGAECSECTTDNTPPAFAVTISGVTDRDCSECEQFNDTFIIFNTVAFPCAYVFDFDPAVCGAVDQIFMQITNISGRRLQVVIVANSASDIEFRSAVLDADPFDCSAVSGVDCPLFSDIQDECWGTDATCTVTAI